MQIDHDQIDRDREAQHARRIADTRRDNLILSAVSDVADCYNALIGFEDTVPAKLRRALDRLNDAMAQ